MKSKYKSGIQRRFGATFTAAAAAICMSIVPGVTAASASTPVARTVTDCTSWGFFYSGRPEWQVCIVANDRHNGSQVVINRNSCHAAVKFLSWRITRDCPVTEVPYRGIVLL
jgi:hypothetical protein